MRYFLNSENLSPRGSPRWLLATTEAPARDRGLEREERLLSPRSGPQTAPCPHVMSRIYSECKKKNTGPERSRRQGGRKALRASPARAPGQRHRARAHFPQPAHTRCTNVVGLMHGPRHGSQPPPSASRPLILPMWLRAMGPGRKEGREG